MVTFEVKDMTCGHCVRAITQAVAAVDSAARVQVDLETHRVQVEPIEADARRLAGAIEQAGYTPVPISGDASTPQASVPRGGCCCRRSASLQAA